MIEFDTIVGNPPFQDTENRNTTQHKLWITFTQRTFDQWLKEGGHLLQVSPSSFSSPSSKVLSIFQNKDVRYIDLDTGKYFPTVGSTFSSYLIKNSEVSSPTEIIKNGEKFEYNIDTNTFYLPNDICEHSINIHNKVIFDTEDKLDVRFDYVKCHNVKIKNDDSPISKTKDEIYCYPILHTNSQVWYSKVRQDWADYKKVMWSRSGYMKPFYDNGVHGGTDMVYYVPVSSDQEGENLVHNLNTKLFVYLMKTAKWSGFGNEKVFKSIPKITDMKYSEEEICDRFGLTQDERKYVENY